MDKCPHCGKPLTSEVRPTERALLTIIVSASARDLSVAELAAAANRSREGAFDRTLTAMARKGLIVRERGRVKATEAGCAAVTPDLMN
jgi:predicted transcriptional regulator